MMTPAYPLPKSLELCRALMEEPQRALELTGKGRTVALISDGGQIPGLGAIPAQAALPYLEDQAHLIRKMTNLVTMPLALNAKSSEDLAQVTAILAPACGILCLESLGDEVYQATERLLRPLNLPVFFNPQESRPILALCALTRALALTDRKIAETRIVLAGFESDSLAMVDLLLAAGAVNLVVCDRSGAIHKGRPGPTSWLKEQLAQKTNPQQIKGGLNRSLSGADVYISRATPVGLSKDSLNLMAPRPIVLNFSQALLSPNLLTAANNPLGLGFGPGPETHLPANLTAPLVLAGLFSGILRARASVITQPTRLAVAQALVELVDEPSRLLPLFSKPDLVAKVAEKVAQAVPPPTV